MNLFPKNAQFFEMFDRLATIVAKAGNDLVSIQAKKSIAAKTAAGIRILEEEADTICHTIISEAETTFITPIEREDLHALATSIDDVIDTIEDVAVKFILFDGNLKVRKDSQEFLQLINATTIELSAMITDLSFKEKHLKNIKARVQKVHTLEHEGDQIYRRAMKTLFSKERNAIVILKWKDLFETMEKVMDRMEIAADTINITCLKNF